MSEIEKMKRYIERTGLNKNDRFCMNIGEAFELSAQAGAFPLAIIALAFNYGKAKGYWAAKAEVRR